MDHLSGSLVQLTGELQAVKLSPSQRPRPEPEPAEEPPLLSASQAPESNPRTARGPASRCRIKQFRDRAGDALRKILASANPDAPESLVPPLVIDESESRMTCKEPKTRFENCIVPGDEANELNRIRAIHNFNMRQRLLFWVEFKRGNVRRWVDFKVLKNLEPSYVLTDFVRSLYLWHNRRYVNLSSGEYKQEIEAMVNSETRDLYASATRMDALDHKKRYYRKNKEKM